GPQQRHHVGRGLRRERVVGVLAQLPGEHRHLVHERLLELRCELRGHERDERRCGVRELAAELLGDLAGEDAHASTSQQVTPASSATMVSVSRSWPVIAATWAAVSSLVTPSAGPNSATSSPGLSWAWNAPSVRCTRIAGPSRASLSTNSIVVVVVDRKSPRLNSSHVKGSYGGC